MLMRLTYIHANEGAQRDVALLPSTKQQLLNVYGASKAKKHAESIIVL